MNLTRREKLTVMAGGISLAIFFLLVGVIGPTLRHRATLSAEVNRKDAELREIYAVAAKLRTTAAQSERSAAGEFNLMGYIEDTTTKLGIKDKIEYMKPIGLDAGYEIKLNGIYTEDLVTILYGLKTAPTTITVTRRNLRRVDQSRNMDVIIQVKGSV